MFDAKLAEKLFFEVLRDRQDKDGIEKIISNFRPRDWSWLLSLAHKSELLPIFYIRFCRLGLKKIEPTFELSLQIEYISNFGRNILREKELSKIITHLKADNIPAIPLKGPVFSLLLYDDIAARCTYYDLDVLVQRDRLKEAEESLKRIGFKFEMSQESEAWYHDTFGEITMAKECEPLGKLNLDLHWYLAPDMQEASYVDEFWLNAKETHIGESLYLLPSKEDICIYLAVRAIPCGNRIHIKSLYDFHAFFMKNKDSLALDKFKHFETLIRLPLALELSKKFFDTVIPSEFNDGIRLKFSKKIAINLFTNEDNITQTFVPTLYSGHYYFFRIFVCNFFSAKNIFDWLIKVRKTILIPMSQLTVYYQETNIQKLYCLYIRRLLRLFWDR
jgi:hypothetical protein